MTASKSLYVAMAVTIRQHAEACASREVPVIRRLVLDLCTDLSDDNIRFDKEKFLDACNLSA